MCAPFAMSAYIRMSVRLGCKECACNRWLICLGCKRIRLQPLAHPARTPSLMVRGIAPGENSKWGVGRRRRRAPHRILEGCKEYACNRWL